MNFQELEVCTVHRLTWSKGQHELRQATNRALYLSTLGHMAHVFPAAGSSVQTALDRIGRRARAGNQRRAPTTAATIRRSRAGQGAGSLHSADEGTDQCQLTYSDYPPRSRLQAKAGDGAKVPSVRILAYTGGVMPMPGIGPVVIDLAGLDLGGSVPLLADHETDIG